MFVASRFGNMPPAMEQMTMIRTLTMVAAALLVASSASAQQWAPNSPS
jgi:hypothetical protein